MMNWVSEYVFNSLVGWLGIGGLIIAALIAVAWFFPPLRTVAAAGAAGVAAALAAYGRGYRDATRKQKELDEQRERDAIEAAKRARADAERDAASGVRDSHDRDRV